MDKEDLLNIKPKKNMKKPLIYGAIAFLIFIIAVIVYAIYSNSKQGNVVLPPQVNEVPKGQSNGFKEVPIEENTSAISEKLNKNVVINNVSNENNKTVNNKKKGNEIIENNVKKTQNQTVKTNENKEVMKKKEIIKKQIKHVSGKYYIQVAALIKYKKPNKKFLDLIKKEGFDYRLYNTYIIKNHQKIPITKLLIGPFKNEQTAREKLKLIKEKITQNAFLFKVK